jgi:hypothetical protein
MTSARWVTLFALAIGLVLVGGPSQARRIDVTLLAGMNDNPGVSDREDDFGGHLSATVGAYVKPRIVVGGQLYWGGNGDDTIWLASGTGRFMVLPTKAIDPYLQAGVGFLAVRNGESDVQAMPMWALGLMIGWREASLVLEVSDQYRLPPDEEGGFLSLSAGLNFGIGK